ncbi:hypothetical protein BgiBS90_024827, partial [Biomphalaria glabrata]
PWGGNSSVPTAVLSNSSQAMTGRPLDNRLSPGAWRYCETDFLECSGLLEIAFLSDAVSEYQFAEKGCDKNVSITNTTTVAE